MKLTHAPLVETVFELRWQLSQSNPSNSPKDSNYKLLVGQLFERIRDEYGFHEQLPSASIPDEIFPYGVQHRFRIAENEWPLIQLGPGIIAINETTKYDWNDFEKRANKLVETLFDVYPGSHESLVINRMTLHYIDAIKIDFEKVKTLEFLKDKLNIEIKLPSNLFESDYISNDIEGLIMQFSYNTNKPKGIIHLKFARGLINNEDALIWETIIQSFNGDIPKLPDENSNWLNNAHDITHDWFIKITDGELIRSFK